MCSAQEGGLGIPLLGPISEGETPETPEMERPSGSQGAVTDSLACGSRLTLHRRVASDMTEAVSYSRAGCGPDLLHVGLMSPRCQ